MKVGRWSTTAGNNTSTPPDGWPEGQAASTVNDCARENMAAIRTVFNDAQFFDQDFTPTFSTVTAFTVTGDQTSAIHAGRRLKLFDASTMYATVTTASFTAVTTIHVVTDSGSNLTNSLSSFAIAILSQDSIPRTISVSSVAAANTPKAWMCFELTNTASVAPIIRSSYNVSSISRSAVSVYRINFTNAMADSDYAVLATGEGNINAFYSFNDFEQTPSTFKFKIKEGIVDGSGAVNYTLFEATATNFNLVFYR
jgi:hypothetical protein